MPAAIGERLPSTLIAIAPFEVLIVTVRVSPAASGAGWLVGQFWPCVAPLPDRGDPPNGCTTMSTNATITTATAPSATRTRGSVVRRD